MKKAILHILLPVLTAALLCACSSGASDKKDRTDSDPVKDTKAEGLITIPEDKLPPHNAENGGESGTNDSAIDTACNETVSESEVMSDIYLSSDTGFYYTEVPEEIRSRMRGLSYPADDSSALISWDELRYMKVLYVNYSGAICSGELVCNAAIADDLLDIFKQLYAAGYQINEISLVDKYNADDDLSIAADNTSCFNYRVVEGTTRLSNHGLGRAIDINPLYNPCVYVSGKNAGRVSPPEGSAYADRSKSFPHKIDENDLAYKLFTAHGFKWGGYWNSLKDYQHFEKK